MCTNKGWPFLTLHALERDVLAFTYGGHTGMSQHSWQLLLQEARMNVVEARVLSKSMLGKLARVRFLGRNKNNVSAFIKKNVLWSQESLSQRGQQL